MTWEELKQKLKELGVNIYWVSEDNKVFVTERPALGFSNNGDLSSNTEEGYDYKLAKRMSYEDMYKVVEILCKYKEK